MRKTKRSFIWKYSIGCMLLFGYSQAQEVAPVTDSTDEKSAGEAVVVIGYGKVKKKDLSGSVDLLTAEDFNKGATNTVTSLISGKAAGVRITNGGGAPDSDPNIRIRAGASLNASNSPLIVIDDVPISNNVPAGQTNPLAFMNPNDIEAITILKDASATAIYGSRASNGVIIVTTKKGAKGRPKYSYSANFQLGTLTKKIDVMSSSDYVSFIEKYLPAQTNLLGIDDPTTSATDLASTPGVIEGRILYDTDWQKEIYKNSFSTEHNFSVGANVFGGKLPLRFSTGYLLNNGILKTSQFQRYTASLGLQPKFLDKHLNFDFNLKGVFTTKDAPDEGAIGAALDMNPTLPVWNPNGSIFGGYYQTMSPTVAGEKVGPSNPVATLEQRHRVEKVWRVLGNIQGEYKFHFLPDFKIVGNYGIDASQSKIYENYDENAIAAYNNYPSNFGFYPNDVYKEAQWKVDNTFDAYLNYTKELESPILSSVNVSAGYTYQNFQVDGTKYETSFVQGVRVNSAPFRYVNKLNLQSFFGRAILGFVGGKYLLTASFRRDGSSLFAKDNRWGNFPAVAVAWNIKEESFLQESKAVKELKLRAGWGITGQQDITGVAGYYPYTALYVNGTSAVQYQFGNTFYTTYRANMYNPNLTWEETRTTNIGLDFNLYNNWVSGSVDFFRRKTKDLLADVPQYEGALKNSFIQNIGETTSKGFELGLNLNPISTDKVDLNINGNIAYNETIVDNLGDITQVPIGGTGIGRGTGINIGYNAVDYRTRSFWLFEAVYDANGNVLPNVFVDKNGDGQITSEGDREFIPWDPKWTYGMGINVTYANWDFTANFRGQIGGRIYNANLLNRGWANYALPLTAQGFINNVMDLWDGTNYTGNIANWSDNQALSTYFISDASFLKFDNVTIGYQFKNLNFLTEYSKLRVYFSVNNVATITDYDGLDPENFGGIEQSPYARPRVYTLGFNFDF